MIFTISGLDVGVQFDWSIGGFTCHGQVLLILWVVSSILLVPSLVYYYAQRRSAPLWVGQPVYAQPKKRLPISLVRLLREQKKSFEVILEGDFFAWYLVNSPRGMDQTRRCLRELTFKDSFPGVLSLSRSGSLKAGLVIGTIPLVAFENTRARHDFIEEVKSIIKEGHDINGSRSRAYYLYSETRGPGVSDFLYSTHLDFRITSLLQRYPEATVCAIEYILGRGAETDEGVPVDHGVVFRKRLRYEAKFIPLVLLDRRLVGGLGVGGYRVQSGVNLLSFESAPLWVRSSFLIPIKFARWLPEDYQSVLFTGYQDFFSAVYESLVSIVKGQLGERGYRPWVSYIGTVFLFIFVSNWVGGLLPWSLISLPRGGISAPTGDINVVVALSVLTSMSYFYAGLKARGLGFFGRYVLPGIGFLPLNVLEEFSKPLSLSFRLFGNVLADEIVGCVLCSVFGLFIPLPVMVLGIFSGSVQALVFATLTAAYVADAFE
jgi:F-type H+-transporting ATPase subunit a